MAAKEQPNYLVYIHKNKINNKVYIGQTHQLPHQRWGKDGNGYRTSPHFYYAIQKYGWNNFQHIIVKNHLTAEEADKLEMELIQQYNSIDSDCGYNIRLGGEHGFHYTEEQKKQLSISLRKNSHNHKNAHKIRCKETNDVFGTVADDLINDEPSEGMKDAAAFAYKGTLAMKQICYRENIRQWMIEYKQLQHFVSGNLPCQFRKGISSCKLTNFADVSN